MRALRSPAGPGKAHLVQQLVFLPRDRPGPALFAQQQAAQAETFPWEGDPNSPAASDQGESTWTSSLPLHTVASRFLCRAGSRGQRPACLGGCFWPLDMGRSPCALGQPLLRAGVHSLSLQQRAGVLGAGQASHPVLPQGRRGGWGIVRREGWVGSAWGVC